MEISFLGSAHGRRAVKTFSAAGCKSYPPIKNFNSQSYEIEKTTEGLREKLKLVREHANKGDCMMKGFLRESCKSESRTGKVDREALTENLILDIDGIILPHVSISPPLELCEIQVIADKIVDKLPEVFQGVSYIVHASSSMGMKGNKICMHIDFALTEKVAPQALKEYVVYLNHATDMFERNFTLSASGTALSFPLDRTVVDNSHLIFIAPPEFKDNIVDPIPNIEDRISLVEKYSVTVNLTEQIKAHANSAKNSKDNKNKISVLRNIDGLPLRVEKTTRVTVDGRPMDVVRNPDGVTMRFAADNGDFIAYNINDGDSAGYYVIKHNPTVVRNFKGEPNFLFEMADPETYLWHMETFLGNADGSNPSAKGSGRQAKLMPLVFRDAASNAYHNALIDIGSGLIDTIHKTDRSGLQDWMVQYEGTMPENVPIWDYEFRPQCEDTINYRERFINKYTPSEYMRRAVVLPDDMVPLDYATAFQLAQWCPTITELILHVLGRDMKLLNHFLNWLAAALQKKDKLTTAWILQGTQGTGKGVLFENIITPLVGVGTNQALPYAAKVRIENIEDQFNLWMECALFVAFDEFRLEDSAASKKLFNKIKGMITELHEPIRGMRENLRNVRTYTNFLFFSNDQDVITIPPDDRRFNVAPRQEEKLLTLWPDARERIKTELPKELQAFACAMYHFQVDWKMASHAMDNDAKRKMRMVSQTSIQDFVHAFKHGDLEFFLPILDMDYIGGSAGGYILPAQNIVKSHLRDMDKGDMSRLSVEELRILYCALISTKTENATKFGKLMGRQGLESKKMRINKKPQRGYEFEWKLGDNRLEDLRALYLTQMDHEFAPEKATNVAQFPKL